MAIPLTHFAWLSSGFFLGMFFMYNVVPFRTNDLFKYNQEPPNPVLKFGHPGPINDLFERTSYSVSYNRKDRIPYWVGEHLTKDNLKNKEGVSRDNSRFTDDAHIPALFRAYTKDYTGSGYDRGHMSPAADALRSQQAMDETFLMTNIAPQVGPGFNRQYWAYVEKFCRGLTNNFTDVYVYTGPLFLPRPENQEQNVHALADIHIQFEQNRIKVIKGKKEKYKMEYNVIGSNYPNVAVPTHFYKILLVTTADDKFALGAFVLPNQAINSRTPLVNFQVDLRAIEKASGLEFFALLNRKEFSNLCSLIHCDV